ncbi:class I SAM-dependent methyltransferase [Desulfococcaceae bacterium HSG7]|nr:class I SAM-dependent methyltransferase [Desulfococcaceae bacterium HSG7]
MKNHIYDLMFEMENSYWWYVARRKIILEQIKKIHPIIKGRRPKILDYGCGTGNNLIHFQKFGQIFGMDASEQAVDFCRQRGLKSVIQVNRAADIDILNPFGVSFDVITLLDVLEHAPDDVKMLKRITKLLNHGGIVFVTVPAFEPLWSGEDYVSAHIRRYKKSELIRVFHKAGIKVEMISYFNTILFPCQVANIYWDRLFNPKSMYETSIKKIPDSVNSLLSFFFSIEAHLLRVIRLPIGGSIMCWGRVDKDYY